MKPYLSPPNFSQMYPINHFPFSFSLFTSIFLPIIFNLIFSPPTYAYNDRRYDNCAPINSSCGSPGQEITYPFWKDNDLPNYCGHPGFKLDCQENNLIIEIKNQTFSVLNISYESKVLTISIPQLSTDLCPKTQTQLTNTSLDLTLFNLTSSSQNATLLYDCSDLSKENETCHFSCEASSHPLPGYPTPVFNHSLGFFVIDDDEKLEDELKKNCKIEVYVPVLKSEVKGLSINTSITSKINGVLKKGFEVKWLVDDEHCKECLISEGRCGYNTTLDKPMCFCTNGAYFTNCHESSGPIDHYSPDLPSNNTSKSKIIIGVGIAAACSLLLLSFGLFFYNYRHKFQHRSIAAYTVQKNRSNPSYNSSTLSDLQSFNGSTYYGVQLFSYRELEAATEYFNPSKELGDGGFGTVYYAKLGDGREVAIKRLYENNSKRAQQFMNEVEILAHLRHKNLVTLYGCTSRQSRELLLVYEFVPNGTVADHLHGAKAKVGSLPWPTRLKIATETATALLYLHSSDIIHRDVKTQNILLDRDFSVKVADFGLSRLFPLDVTHVSTAPQGTPGYVDPEYHQCYQLTEKSDVYSFGVVLAELISSKPAVDITRRRQEINLSNMAIIKIQNNELHELVDPSLGFETDLKVKKEITRVAELVFQCLQGTKEIRPSMEEVLEILSEIQGGGNGGNKKNKLKADVVDIPDDDMHMLKSDLSPVSTQADEHSVRRYIPHASV